MGKSKTCLFYCCSTKAKTLAQLKRQLRKFFSEQTKPSEEYKNVTKVTSVIWGNDQKCTKYTVSLPNESGPICVPCNLSVLRPDFFFTSLVMNHQAAISAVRSICIENSTIIFQSWSYDAPCTPKRQEETLWLMHVENTILFLSVYINNVILLMRLVIACSY